MSYPHSTVVETGDTRTRTDLRDGTVLTYRFRTAAEDEETRTRAERWSSDDWSSGLSEVPSRGVIWVVTSTGDPDGDVVSVSWTRKESLRDFAAIVDGRRAQAAAAGEV